MLPMTKTAATSDYPPLTIGDGILCGDDRPLRCEAQRDEAPDCDQELARQGDDCDAADSTLKRANTVPEPCRMAALWLVAKPKPGELDERFAGSAVAGAIDAPIAIHAAALKRRWGKTQIAGDLPPVVEHPVEHLPRQDGGEVHANSADRAKRFDRSACGSPPLTPSSFAGRKRMRTLVDWRPSRASARQSPRR